MLGKVTELTPKGVVVTPHDGGKPFVAQASEIEEDHAIARLNLQSGDEAQLHPNDRVAVPHPDTGKPVEARVVGRAAGGKLRVQHDDGTKHVLDSKASKFVKSGNVTREQRSTPEEVTEPIPEGMRPATPDDRARLKIPPAWTQVVVATDPTVEQQARGRDSGGKHQYRYTPEHDQQQADKKFARIRELHKVIPQLDAALARDSETNDTAAAVYLMRKMGVRNGGSTTNAKVKAYGATNLEVRHVVVEGDSVRLDFIGKEGVHQDHEVTDPRLKQLLLDRVKGKQPTDRLFKTSSAKTLAYVKKETGNDDFIIHDLRTYLATNKALEFMAGISPPQEQAEFKEKQALVAKLVSEILGNQPEMALKSYISPTVWSTWAKDPEWTK